LVKKVIRKGRKGMKKIILIGLLFVISCEQEENIYKSRPYVETQCPEEEPYKCTIDIYEFCCPSETRYCGENYECYPEIVESGKASSNCDSKWVYCEAMDLCCPQDRPYCTRTRMCVESNTIGMGEKND
jgi:hypothetical protein